MYHDDMIPREEDECEDFPTISGGIDDRTNLSAVDLEGTNSPDSVDILASQIPSLGISIDIPERLSAVDRIRRLSTLSRSSSGASRRSSAVRRQSSVSPVSLFGKPTTPMTERRESTHILGGVAIKRHKDIKSDQLSEQQYQGKMKFPKETVSTRTAYGKFTIHLLRQFAIPAHVHANVMPPPAQKYDITISEIWGVDSTNKALARLVREANSQDSSITYVKAEQGPNKLGLLIPSNKMLKLAQSPEISSDHLLHTTLVEWCRTQRKDAQSPAHARSGALLRDKLQHADGTGRLIMRFCYAIANKLRCQPPSIIGLAPTLSLEGIDRPLSAMPKEKKKKPRKRKPKPKPKGIAHVELPKAFQHAYAAKIQACVRCWLIAPLNLVSAKLSSRVRVRKWNARMWRFPEARKFHMAMFKRLKLKRREGNTEVPEMNQFEAAMEIQRIVRGYFARKRLRKQIAAAMKIQEWLRAIWFRREAHARMQLFKKAVERLQRWVRNLQKPEPSIWKEHTPSKEGTRRGSILLKRSKRPKKPRPVGISRTAKSFVGQWLLRSQIGKKRHQSRVHYY